jgi:hypothetical protein
MLNDNKFTLSIRYEDGAILQIPCEHIDFELKQDVPLYHNHNIPDRTMSAEMRVRLTEKELGVIFSKQEELELSPKRDKKQTPFDDLL